MHPYRYTFAFMNSTTLLSGYLYKLTNNKSCINTHAMTTPGNTNTVSMNNLVKFGDQLHVLPALALSVFTWLWFCHPQLCFAQFGVVELRFADLWFTQPCFAYLCFPLFGWLCSAWLRSLVFLRASLLWWPVLYIAHLAGDKKMYIVWVKMQLLEKIVYTSRFEIIF